MEEQKQVHPHIVPSVGRVVWYWPGGDDFAQDNVDRMFHFITDQPMRADICFVHNDGTVTLSVNDHLGDAYQRPNIVLHQGDAENCSLPRPFATWMPFQRGQAMKTAEAEAKAVGSFQTEHERLSLAMLAEQVRELRILNDTREVTLNAMKVGGFQGTGAISGGVQLCAQQAQQQTPEVLGMPAHQVRMRFERDELSVRLMKLRDFKAGREFAELDETEQELMHEQAEAMQRYLACLQDRIALFNEQQDGA